MFTLKVGVMPGKVTEVMVEGGTVNDAITLAGLDAQGYTVRYNGSNVIPDTQITKDGVISLIENIKGN